MTLISSCRRKYTTQPMMTARKVDKQTTLRRKQESRISDLLQYTSRSQKLCNAAKSEVMISNARKSNFVAQVAAENIARERMDKNLENARRTSLKNDQNCLFAERISLRNKERQKIELEIQRICETSDELKELERHLKIAYVNKERAAQYQEMILLKKLEQARDQAIDEQMEYDRQLEIQRDTKKIKIQREQLSRQKEVLQKQILDNKEHAKSMKAEALKDKEIVDAIIARINEEDKLELKERKRKKEETRTLVQQFYEERERHKRILAQQEQDQEDEIAKYNELMEERKKSEELLKKVSDEERRLRWEKITEEAKAQNQSKKMLDTLRDMLWQEELEEKKANEEKQRALERARRKDEMMRDNQAQIQAKREMIAEMEKEDERLVNLMLAKFKVDEEDERKKRESKQKEKEQFTQEAQNQRKERQLMFEMEKQKEVEERNAGVAQEEYRQRVVLEARRKLLAQHAAQLKGFFPKGAILDQEEVEIIS